MRNLITIIGIVFLCVCSCGKTNDTEKAVKQLMGHPFIVAQGHTLPKGNVLVSYVDSMGCVPCKLRLQQWKTLFHDEVSRGLAVVFVAHPSVEEELRQECRKMNYHPRQIIVDHDNAILKANHIPSDFRLQTFLLDHSHTVRMVGNPVHNAKIHDMMKQWLMSLPKHT